MAQQLADPLIWSDSPLVIIKAFACFSCMDYAKFMQSLCMLIMQRCAYYARLCLFDNFLQHSGICASLILETILQMQMPAQFSVGIAFLDPLV